MHAEQPVTDPALPVIGGLFVGMLFALFGGLGFESSGRRDAVGGDGPVVILESDRPVFSPLFAVVGFLSGAALGSLIGLLWLRGRAGHATAVLLGMGVGGISGWGCAALFGSRTTTTIIGNSIATEHGPPPEVVALGAVLGIILGALSAWWLSRTVR